MDSTVIIFVIVALLIGLGVGWFLGSRGAAPLRDELAALRERAGAAERESASAGERAARSEQLQTLLNAVTGERDEAIRAHAALQADARNFDVRMKDLTESKDALIAQFRVVGDQLLEKAHKDFLEKAGERFTAADKASENKLKSLLAPVETTLKRYEEGLAKVEKERVGSYESMREQLGQLVQHNDLVRKETQRLANVMTSSPKARGRWGEEQLKNILESAGFSENIDFELQTTVDDGDQKLRPDCIINLPGERCIVVDVKNVWTAFEQAFDEENQERRALLLDKHAKAMESCAKDLSRKGYWKQFERSPDFVVMFIPGEHILAAAAERAPDMIASAARNNVLIASTINMLALARFFAGMWRQEAVAAQAKEIAALGKELHARLQTMGSHVVSLGRNLRLATDTYDDFIGSLDSKVLTQAKRFEDLNVADGNKPIISPSRIDFTPKLSTKLLSVAEVLSDDKKLPPPSANEDDAAA